MADVPIFPPLKGLRFPIVGGSDLLDGGMFIANGWTIKGNTLTIQEGYASIVAKQTITGDTTGKVRCIFSYDKSNTKFYVAYVVGRNLMEIDYAVGTETTLVSNMLASDASNFLISVAPFRKYFLLGTMQDGLWYVDPETGAAKAGVAAPLASTPILAAGSATGLTGAYKGAYTFVNALGHESNKSPISNTVTVADEKLNWSAIGVGPAGTVSRRFYRTVAGGSLYLFHSTIADNVTTVITGDAVPDSSLGVEAPLTNFVPPESIRHVSSNAIRVFLVSGGLNGDEGFTVHACAIDPDTGEPNFEAYPTELSITFPISGGSDALQATVALPNGDLYVASKFNIWKVTGDVGLEPVIDKVADVGFFSPFAGVLTPYGLFFIDGNSEVWIYDGETLKDVDFPVHEALRTFIVPVAFGVSDYPFVVYHPLTKQVHINVPDTSPPSAFVFDLESNQWNTMRTGFNVAHYSERKRTMFGARTGLTKIYEDNLYLYSFDGAQYTTQVAEFYPTYPDPGKTVQINKLKLEVQELPIVNYVPPTLKVEWALDGDSLYTSSYIDLSPKNIRGSIIYGPPYSSGTILRTTATKTVEVPIHRVAKSVSVRLSTVNNNSSYTNGMQIYKIWLDVDGLDEPSKDDRKFRLDKEL